MDSDPATLAAPHFRYIVDTVAHRYAERTHICGDLIMAAYIRVELHEKSRSEKPDSADYARLHSLLASRNIERYVKVKDVGQQCLPSGFYHTEASDKNVIGQDVNWAAKQVGYPYSYVVVINGGALVRNLEACTCD